MELRDGKQLNQTKADMTLTQANMLTDYWIVCQAWTVSRKWGITMYYPGVLCCFALLCFLSLWGTFSFTPPYQLKSMKVVGAPVFEKYKPSFTACALLPGIVQAEYRLFAESKRSWTTWPSYSAANQRQGSSALRYYQDPAQLSATPLFFHLPWWRPVHPNKIWIAVTSPVHPKKGRTIKIEDQTIFFSPIFVSFRLPWSAHYDSKLGPLNFQPEVLSYGFNSCHE